MTTCNTNHEGFEMTTKHLMRRARELYNVDYVPPHINRANQRAWVRAVISLGNKWLLSQPIGRSA
jgi:hypothetical protein